MTTTFPKPRRYLDDWIEGQVSLTRVTDYGPRNAYGVHFEGVFLGYVIGDRDGWSQQPESNPSVPVEPSYQFVYAAPTRSTAVGHLLMEARTAGLIAEVSAS